MDFKEELIGRLRSMATQGASIRMMVDEIRNHLDTEDGLALVVDAYFRRAFLLPLGRIRDIEGSSRLGGKAYTDEQIDRLILPRITRSRLLWQEM